MTDREAFSSDYRDKTPRPGRETKDQAITDRYAALPEAMRGALGPKQYAWMTDAQKANIERDDLEPDF